MEGRKAEEAETRRSLKTVAALRQSPSPARLGNFSVLRVPSATPQFPIVVRPDSFLRLS